MYRIFTLFIVVCLAPVAVAQSPEDASFSVHVLKHYDQERFLTVARPLLDIKKGQHRRADGSLVIVADPSSKRLILKGTPTAIKEFKSFAAILDVAANDVVVNTERSYLKAYPIFTDPETALKVIQTMLDGTDATVGQDKVSAIIVKGLKEHHKTATDTIATLRGKTGSTKIVKLQHSKSSTILSAVQSLLNAKADGAVNPKGPNLLANTVQNYIVVKGTPAEISEITQLITKLDQASQQLDE